MQSQSNRPARITPGAVARVAIFCFVLSTQPLLLAQDTIYPQKGRGTISRGKIQSVSPTEVVIKVGRSERKFAANDIQRIMFEGEPNGLREGRNSILTGQLQQGLQQLRQLKLDEDATPALKQDLKFFSALAAAKLSLSGNGDKKAAAREMLEFVKANRNSFHFYEAVEILGDLAVSLGKFDSAVRYYGQLSKAPWPGFQLRGAALEAATYQAQGNFAKAAEKFDAVVNSDANTPEAARQRQLARVGKAACQAEAGQPDQAIASLEELLVDADPTDAELFSRMYNALGAAYRKADKPIDAVLAYLQVDILFFANADAHAEALYHLSDLWKQIRKPERSVDARNRLKSRYAGSVWASK